ncbi:hypothetical protein BDZ89DRAFT_435244 [Hymenopellis radicata]|nr:hypothetical protein BDZ89DRAFT_435244 [Hymenopellis radicata]
MHIFLGRVEGDEKCGSPPSGHQLSQNHGPGLCSGLGRIFLQGKGKAKLESQDDVLDSFESCVVDRIDLLLERVDTSLDEYLGRSKAPAIAINPIVEKKKSAAKTVSGQVEVVVQHAAHLEKPQLRFKRPVDNSNSPWYPRLSHKYHAMVPLGYKFTEGEDVDSTNILLSHPYHYEIKHISYPPHMFLSAPPILPKPFDTTSFTWVNTTEALQAMLDKLRQATEIAVDLEHHSYRTYAGFLCLMQLSTREEDWIIDAIALRDELECLNEVFTKPEITKVFHGADSDIIWLQQDLNLYVVNMFDTYHASKILAFPKHGLANLLEMYCDFIPDKRYQLADWRVRPLPEAMLRYARSDTHFLLYIYDNLRNALLDRGESQARAVEGGPSSFSPHSFVREVLARSEETTLKVYEKELYDAGEGSGSNGWDNLARKWNKISLSATAPNAGPDALHKYVYKAVHAWRDRVAREEDESTRYILPNHFLFQLAESPPPDMPALLRIFHSPPPVIKRRARELLDAIRDAVRAHFSAIQATGATEAVGANKDAPVAVEPPQDVITTENPTSSKLWSNPSSRSTTSSLFGPAALEVKTSSSLSISTSSLFGLSQPVKGSSGHGGGRFQDVLNKIHSSLSIAPSVPQISPISAPEDVIQVDEDDGESTIEMQAEVPFVPASQRAKREVVEDSLVVVGQARQKKRKRTTTIVNEETSTPPSGSKSKKAKASDGESATKEEEPFDFASIPNVLDQVPASHEEKRVKKKGKQKKGGTGYTYGDFPAPPKAQNDLKSGNRSHTFK